MTGVQGPALLSWAGGASDLGATPVFFIANTPDNTSVAAGGITPAYPLARARQGMNFSINLRSNVLAENVTVTLIVNGLSTLTHSFLFVPSGRFTVAGPVSIPAGSKIDVKVSCSSSGVLSGPASVSATLELF